MKNCESCGAPPSRRKLRCEYCGRTSETVMHSLVGLRSQHQANLEAQRIGVFGTANLQQQQALAMQQQRHDHGRRMQNIGGLLGGIMGGLGGGLGRF